MTGARNENSVLFSLKNLQALATGSGTPSSPSPAAGGAGGLPGGEGSGLIDIRALASTTGVGENGDASGAKDELLSMGSQGGAFGSLGSPMLAPAAADDDGNKKMMIWAVVAAVGMLSMAAVAVVYFLRPQSGSGPAPGVGVAPNVAAVAPVPQQPAAPVAAAAPAAAPSEGELAAQRAAAAQPHESDKNASSASASAATHHKHGDTPGAAKPAGEQAIPEAESKKAAPAPAKTGPRTIDDLLDGALGNSSAPKPTHGGADPGAGANLPDTPSRDQALAAMNAIKPAVQACAHGENGVALVDVNVAGATGHVTNAQVKGVTGPAGSCIAQAVRKAQFPKFKQNVFKLTFPFKL
jgi:hypothetical protein